jgi:glycosyltransferase involved in cell wall biosynthesis
VVDDGSTDATGELMEFYCEKDSRIKYHHRPANRNKGANACRNIGLEKSVGDFIIFFDSDDLMASTCLEGRTTHFAKNNGKDMLVFSMGIFSEKSNLNIDPERKVVNKSIAETIEEFILDRKIPWQVSRPIIKSEFIKNKIAFNEKIQNFQDDEFNLRVLKYLQPDYLSIDITDSYYKNDGLGKYSSLKDHQNIINCFYEYYSTVFNVLNKQQIKDLRNKLVFKFYDQVFGYYKPGLDPKIISETILLFRDKLSLTIQERFIFNSIIFLNTYYYNEKGYYFLSKKMKSIMFKKINPLP